MNARRNVACLNKHVECLGWLEQSFLSTGGSRDALGNHLKCCSHAAKQPSRNLDPKVESCDSLALLSLGFVCYALLYFGRFAFLCFASPCFVFSLVSIAMHSSSLPSFVLLCVGLLCPTLLCVALLYFVLLCFALLCFALLRLASFCLLWSQPRYLSLGPNSM